MWRIRDRTFLSTLIPWSTSQKKQPTFIYRTDETLICPIKNEINEYNDINEIRFLAYICYKFLFPCLFLIGWSILCDIKLRGNAPENRPAVYPPKGNEYRIETIHFQVQTCLLASFQGENKQQFQCHFHGIMWNSIRKIGEERHHFASTRTGDRLESASSCPKQSRPDKASVWKMWQ